MRFVGLPFAKLSLFQFITAFDFGTKIDMFLSIFHICVKDECGGNKRARND